MKTPACSLSPSKIPKCFFWVEKKLKFLFTILNPSYYCFSAASLKFPCISSWRSQPRISGEFIYRLEGSSSFSSTSTSSGSLELYLLTPQASKTVASSLNFSHLTLYRLGVPQREKRYIVIYSNMFPIFEGQILQSCLLYSSKLTVFYERISLIPTYFILLCCFIALHRYYGFYKLKVCGNPASSKSTGTIFPAAFALFVSASHFGNSPNISNLPVIIVFVMVISDLLYYYCNSSRVPWTMPI